MSCNRNNKRFEVRRTTLDSVRVELQTDSLEGAINLFMAFKEVLDERMDVHLAEASNDVQTFCVWDTHQNHVAFHEGKFLTTYLLRPCTK